MRSVQRGHGAQLEQARPGADGGQQTLAPRLGRHRGLRHRVGLAAAQVRAGQGGAGDGAGVQVVPGGLQAAGRGVAGPRGCGGHLVQVGRRGLQQARPRRGGREVPRHEQQAAAQRGAPLHTLEQVTVLYFTVLCTPPLGRC